MADQSTTQKKRKAIRPATTIALSFLAIIAVGTILLSLPIAWANGRPNLFDALFTAVSSVCVTGLVVVDTGTTFSTFGKVVVISLIQLGGLGYMAVATVTAMMFGKRLGLSERILLKESSGATGLSGVMRLTRNTVLFTVVVELIGATILAIRFAFDPNINGIKTITYGLFHAISAFCNAGFDIMGPIYGKFSSVTHYKTDWVVSLTIPLLIIIGGLGFPVIEELLRRGGRRLSLHSKLVIVTTIALLAFGTLAVLAAEWSNPYTMEGLSAPHKVLASFFQSASARTAGYNSVDMANLNPASIFLLGVLMFIGASPGGTGGGIKTTTFVLLIVAVISIVRGRPDTEVFGRRLPISTILKALAVTLLAAGLCVVAMLIITFSELQHGENAGFLAVQFEVLSAWGTVGLSTGITPKLHAVGRIVLMVMMLIGRVGPLTAFTAFAEREKPVNRRLAEDNVVIS